MSKTRERNGWISSEPGRYLQSHKHEPWALIQTHRNVWRAYRRDNEAGWTPLPITGKTLTEVMNAVHAVWKQEDVGVRRSHLLSFTTPLEDLS